MLACMLRLFLTETGPLIDQALSITLHAQPAGT